MVVFSGQWPIPFPVGVTTKITVNIKIALFSYCSFFQQQTSLLYSVLTGEVQELSKQLPNCEGVA